MKLSYGIITVDGMPFIHHQLKQIYPQAHQIIICEGGDVSWVKTHGYRHSRDGTLEIIRQFPDPEKKILLIQKDWQDKNEMCYEYSRHISGDILWHIDVDEFVDPAHIPFIKTFFESDSNYDTIALPQLVFWGDTQTIMGARFGPSEDWSWLWPDIERIFRVKKGLHIQHIPGRGYYHPGTGAVTPCRIFPAARFLSSEIYTYHFSYVLPKSVQTKMEYYNSRHPESIKKDWYQDIFMQFKKNREKWIQSGFDVQPLNSDKFPSYKQKLKALGGDLPPFLKNLEAELIKECQEF